MTNRFRRPLDDLERSVRMPLEHHVEMQDIEPPGEYLAPEDLDRIRLVASIEGAGRLKPRDASASRRRSHGAILVRLSPRPYPGR